MRHDTDEVFGPALPDVRSTCGAFNLGMTMKKIALATALSLATTSAFAGGLPEPQQDPIDTEITTSNSSSGGIIVPLLLLLVVAAAVASN
jgi:hypothetical protein